MIIKVLGSGCNSCKRLYENTKMAFEELNLKGKVEYVTDLKEVIKYGVNYMPVLVVNEKVKCSGKVLNTNEIKDILFKDNNK